MQPKRQEGVQRRSFPIPDAKLAYCGVCNLFLHSRCLTDHRHRFHSFNHTCFLCDPINGKLIEGIRIKEHLAEVHSSKGFRTCRCCNYIFKKYSDLIKHCKVLDRTGKLGNQQILAKSQQQPGELKAENFAQEFKEFRARQKARQEAIALITCQSRSERLDKKPSQDIQLPRKVLDDGPENTSQSSFITNQKTPVAPYSNEKRDGNLFTANQTDKNDVQDFCNQFLFPVLKEFHASLTPDELAVMLAGNQ